MKNNPSYDKIKHFVEIKDDIFRFLLSIQEEMQMVLLLLKILILKLVLLKIYLLTLKRDSSNMIK